MTTHIWIPSHEEFSRNITLYLDIIKSVCFIHFGVKESKTRLQYILKLKKYPFFVPFDFSGRFLDHTFALNHIFLFSLLFISHTYIVETHFLRSLTRYNFGISVHSRQCPAPITRRNDAALSGIRGWGRW